MLDNLGYDYRVEKTKGNTLHFIKISRKNLIYEVNVNISPSKSKLWTSVGLADIKPEHAAQSEKLLKLLELNQKIGPSHFYYYAPHKMVYITRPMDNRAITAKLLREHIDELMEQIVANEEHWDSRKWSRRTNHEQGREVRGHTFAHAFRKRTRSLVCRYCDAGGFVEERGETLPSNKGATSRRRSAPKTPRRG